METEVGDPKDPTNHEKKALAIEVLQLLDGLGVAAVADVLDMAAGIARTYTKFDVTAVWFQKGVASHRKNAS